jgi:hypothetical protein
MTTTVEAILNDHNIMHPKMRYKMGVEEEKSISFSDLKVHRNRNTKNLGILGSLRADMVILYSSNHPSNHKFAALGYC